jgi:hypothetical protein
MNPADRVFVRDLVGAIEFLGEVFQTVQVGLYDERFEPHMTALVYADLQQVVRSKDGDDRRSDRQLQTPPGCRWS